MKQFRVGKVRVVSVQEQETTPPNKPMKWASSALLPTGSHSHRVNSENSSNVLQFWRKKNLVQLWSLCSFFITFDLSINQYLNNVIVTQYLNTCYVLFVYSDVLSPTSRMWLIEFMSVIQEEWYPVIYSLGLICTDTGIGFNSSLPCFIDAAFFWPHCCVPIFVGCCYSADNITRVVNNGMFSHHTAYVEITCWTNWN